MTYFKAFILAFLWHILSGCNTQTAPDQTSHETSVTPSDLIGHSLQYTYGESIYHVTFDNDKEMHWEAMSGEEKGTKEEETYEIEVIRDNILFITWGEANGIGVSQILDFDRGIVHNHLLRGRDISIGQGNIELLRK